MKNTAQKFLVIDAGGIGGITAAHMKRAGYDIEVVDNLPTLIATLMVRTRIPARPPVFAAVTGIFLLFAGFISVII
jgi:hypothetical protein